MILYNEREDYSMNLPRTILSGFWKEGHVQGIAVDLEKQHIYFSFTTILLKTDFEGTPLGSVRNLAGHLGCITFDADRRRVYGSLELKHDSIGKGIINRTGWNPSEEDNFYLVSFDVDKIDRMYMDAEADGIMQAVWLREVVTEYAATDPISGCKHHYGCSGIDGTAYGPVFGTNGPKKIMVAYGIYCETSRTDNDHNVILQYDPDIFEKYGMALNQSQPHHNGPESAEDRHFFYTGNTRWGVQNLEYDPASNLWLVCVYKGQKETFTNFPMFLIDGSAAPQRKELTGRPGETGNVLTLAQTQEIGLHGIPGCTFPLGSTGVFAVGDGQFYFSDPISNAEEKTFSSTVQLYRMDKDAPQLFTLCQ